MTDQDGNKQKKGGILALLRRPSTRYSLGGILVVLLGLFQIGRAHV